MGILGSVLGGGGLGGGFGGAPGGFQPGPYSPLGGSPGGYGGLPGLNTPGLGTGAPTAQMPVPLASQAQAAQILQNYGVQINGAGASPQILGTVADGLRRYNRQSIQGLQSISILSSQGGSTTGRWFGGSGGGRIELYARGGAEPVKLRTITHELGHHWSLAADSQGGDSFLQALNTPGGYVSPYAQTGDSDKMAEAVAYMLVGPQEFSKEMSILPSWNPSPQATQIVQQRVVAGRPTI